MSAKVLVRKLLVASLGGSVALLGWWLLSVRLLDITFDASSVTLLHLEALSGDGGDETMVAVAFLDRVEEIQAFSPGAKDRNPIFPWRSPSDLGGRPIALSPAPKVPRCDTVRIEMAREGGGQARPVVSIHVEPSHDGGDCALVLRAVSDGRAEMVHAGTRLDFVLKPPPAAADRPAKPTKIVENVSVRTLSAALQGAIAGSELGTCSRGRNLDLTGRPLEAALVALNPDGTALDAWVRGRLITGFDVDGGACLSALYAPKSIVPSVLFAVAFAAIWTLLS